MAVARIDAKFDPVIYLCIGCSYFLAVAGGSALVLRDELTLGSSPASPCTLGQLIWPMFAIAWLFNIIRQGSAAYSRIESLLGERSDIEEPSSPAAVHLALPLVMKGWHTGWSRAPLLGMNFTLSGGGMLGIVGAHRGGQEVPAPSS